MHPDALGDEIIIGNLYGYSRSDGGHSHITIGIASSVANGRVRLTNCQITRFLYGEPTTFRDHEKPADVSMRSMMVFPISNKVK